MSLTLPVLTLRLVSYPLLFNSSSNMACFALGNGKQRIRLSVSRYFGMVFGPFLQERSPTRTHVEEGSAWAKPGPNRSKKTRQAGHARQGHTRFKPPANRPSQPARIRQQPSPRMASWQMTQEPWEVSRGVVIPNCLMERLDAEAGHGKVLA